MWISAKWVSYELLPSGSRLGSRSNVSDMLELRVVGICNCQPMGTSETNNVAPVSSGLTRSTAKVVHNYDVILLRYATFACY